MSSWKPSSRAFLIIALMLGPVEAVVQSYFSAAAPAWKARFQVDNATWGMVFLLSGVGMFLSGLARSALSRHISIGRKLLLGFGLLGVACAVAAAAKGFVVFAAAPLAIGFGGGLLNISSNVMISDLKGDDHRRWISVAQLFVGAAGAAASFVLADVANRLWDPAHPQRLQLPFGVYAALFVLVLVFVARIDFDVAFKEPPPQEESSQTRRVGRAFIGLMAVCVTVHVFSDMALSAWIPVFAKERFHTDIRESGWLLTLYLAGFPAGRLLFAHLPLRVRDWTVLAIAPAGAFVSAFGALHAERYALSGALFFVAGTCASIDFPAMLSVIGARFHGRTARPYAVVWAAVAVAGMTSPPILGKLADVLSLRGGGMATSLSWGVLGFLALSAIGTGAALITRHRREGRGSRG
ncbi:MAG: MFS transporter [Planctomycetota bacterium]